jgi:hypothetical protein
VILHRCFSWESSVRPDEPNGPLWFPRPFQGDGRHDNPSEYGVLYLAAEATACVVEQLAPFRGTRLSAAMLRRRGLPLAIAAIEAADETEVLDLDDPAVLRDHRLRPSLVATRRREVTQPQALRLYRSEPAVAALRWWSTYEALWANLTVFDRASELLELRDVRELALEDDVVVAAANFLGL